MISFLMSEPSRLLSFQQFRQNREIGCQVGIAMVITGFRHFKH